MYTISLLRSFPYVLNHKQQIAFSTLSHLLDHVLSQDYFQRKFMQEHSGKGDEELSITERNEMLASLWATVSTLYFIEKVCRCEPDMLGFAYEKSNLPNFVPSVSNLRNAKDHIAQRIENFANSQYLSPINGLVRWTFNPRVEGEEVVISLQIFTVDPMLKSFKIPTADGIDVNTKPFDHLALFAFGDCLQVSRAHEALQGFLQLLTEQLAFALKKAEADSATKKTELSEAEQRPFCVVGEGRFSI
ncbi:hypothetical protein ROTO_00590 [Roseovarius tolerans]|uniref:Uncharacterized protein n=2 Tax=Roseovarius tolerans TaxID=74031 RepID=A0A0L6CZX1_9RHOB|nr:hypothetical protein ROTO_00590 [Roseovarius tolerans]